MFSCENNRELNQELDSNLKFKNVSQNPPIYSAAVTFLSQRPKHD